MKNNMSIFGVGPRIALLTLPYALLCIFVILKFQEPLPLSFIPGMITLTAGLLLLGAGLFFYLVTGKTFMKEFPKGELIVKGPFGLCRNPIYASFIVFFLPGLALVLQSGLIFTISLVMYLNFRMAIHGEYKVLKERFGEQYLIYERTVNELFPFPGKK